MSALLNEASSTNFIILEAVLSSPTFSALTVIFPLFKSVPAKTSCPVSFLTGIYSPVIADWSITALPFSIVPSTLIFSPV